MLNKITTALTKTKHVPSSPNANSDANKRQKGYTAVELLTVIAAIGILGTIGGTKLLGKFEENKVNTVVTDFERLSTEMLKCGELYGGNFTDCDIAELVRLGYLEEEIWGDGTNENPWNGNYVAEMVTGNTNQFQLQATGVPQDEYGAMLIAKHRDISTETPTFNSNTFTSFYGDR